VIFMIRSINNQSTFKILLYLVIISVLLFKLIISIKSIISAKKNKDSILKVLEVVPDNNYDLVYNDLYEVKQKVDFGEKLVCMKNIIYDNFSLSYPLSPIILKPCSTSFKIGERVILFKTDRKKFETLGYKTELFARGSLIEVLIIKK
jgi:hypothetical protein